MITFSPATGTHAPRVTWRDGDARRELLDGTRTDRCVEPVLQADILGGWREKVVWHISDERALQIHSTARSTGISRPSRASFISP